MPMLCLALKNGAGPEKVSDLILLSVTNRTEPSSTKLCRQNYYQITEVNYAATNDNISLLMLVSREIGCVGMWMWMWMWMRGPSLDVLVAG